MNVIRLSEDFGTDYFFNWFPKGGDAPSLQNPSELFSDEFMNAHFVRDAEFESLESNAVPIWRFAQDRTPERLEKHLSQGGHVLVDEGFAISSFQWENEEVLQSRFPEYIHKIGFSKEVLGFIEVVDTSMSALKGNMVAYHIRRGDILNADPWKHKQWPAKIEPEELYFHHMEKTAPELLLVFSDTAESVRKFQRIYPQAKGIDEFVDLTKASTAQRDFVELYAMSRASEIVAPPISAFSRAAARLSGRERSRFADIFSQSEMDTAYARLAERFEGGIDNFVTPSEAAQLYAKLTSRLSEWDQDQKAKDIGQSILDAGADNAFMSLLLGINCVYLHDWRSARKYLDAALSDPNSWTENSVAATAIRAHVLGAMGKTQLAQIEFLRAFWRKPLLPDVMAVGSFMLYRRRLKPHGPIPYDPSLTATLRVPHQRVNKLLLQRKILKRRFFDFSAWVAEWPDFVLDKKARRMLKDANQLAALREKVLRVENPETLIARSSFAALLMAKMGEPNSALAENTRCLTAEPDNPMIVKRQAEILALSGAADQAIKLLEQSDLRSEHPFWDFLKGQLYLRTERTQSAIRAFKLASMGDNSTAKIHEKFAEVSLAAGNEEDARFAYERASLSALGISKYRKKYDRLTKRQKL